MCVEKDTEFIAMQRSMLQDTEFIVEYFLPKDTALGFSMMKNELL